MKKHYVVLEIWSLTNTVGCRLATIQSHLQIDIKLRNYEFAKINIRINVIENKVTEVAMKVTKAVLKVELGGNEIHLQVPRYISEWGWHQSSLDTKGGSHPYLEERVTGWAGNLQIVKIGSKFCSHPDVYHWIMDPCKKYIC